MATTTLRISPLWTLIRSESGAVVADQAEINFTNYPLAKSFDPSGRAGKIAVFWDCTTPPAGMELDIELLLLQGPDLGWLRGAVATRIPLRAVALLDTYNCCPVLARVAFVHQNLGAAGEDLEIYGAFLQE